MPIHHPAPGRSRCCTSTPLQGMQADTQCSGCNLVLLRRRDHDAVRRMTKEEAYKVLRLSEGASFERVVQAKNKMLSGPGVDADRTMQVLTGSMLPDDQRSCRRQSDRPGCELRTHKETKQVCSRQCCGSCNACFCMLCKHRARAVRVRQEPGAFVPCAEDQISGCTPVIAYVAGCWRSGMCEPPSHPACAAGCRSRWRMTSC